MLLNILRCPPQCPHHSTPTTESYLAPNVDSARLRNSGLDENQWHAVVMLKWPVKYIGISCSVLFTPV